MDKHVGITIAKRDNQWIHVSEVVSGLACNCTCGVCGKALAAKKGNVKEHHFAHAVNSNCSQESALHLLAKDIIREAKYIKLPEATWKSFLKNIELRDIEVNFIAQDYVFPEKTIVINKVYLEKNHGDFIPDVLLEYDEKQLSIEIYVTHAVDEIKEQKIKNANISTIEIDLSNYLYSSIEEISAIILETTDRKKWIYNADMNKIYNSLIENTVRHKIGRASICPLKNRKEDCISYVDCLNNRCHFCHMSIEAYDKYGRNQYIYCSAEYGLPAGNVSLTDAIKQYHNTLNSIYEERENQALGYGECPVCGEELVEKKDKNGYIVSCKNKGCNFTSRNNVYFENKRKLVRRGKCPICRYGLEMVNGKYGKFLRCTKSKYINKYTRQRACNFTTSELAFAEALLVDKCPDCSSKLHKKHSEKYGVFYVCYNRKCKFTVGEDIYLQIVNFNK